MDYDNTLNLPKTDFSMRAGLPALEPRLLEKWQREGLYETLQREKADAPLFVLHDGPPFSNGDIHLGHALNKILKDFVLRYKNMAGFRAPYVPGWDNHGMPIESAIIKKNKLNRHTMPVTEFRRACRDFALRYVERQSEQFQRLGVLGDWSRPYLTMSPDFEAEEVLIFGEMYERGLIYKGKKPVYWCAHDGTALAEAEIEYADDKCLSVYVKFPVADGKGKLGGAENASFVIWTTTPWTLPGNVAICLHPRLEYALCRLGGETLIVAAALREKALGESAEVIAVTRGADLERLTARHPFSDRESLVITGEHVTAESGTGCVHTAPGHGAEDYFACKPYNLPILVPVDDKGRMTGEAGAFLAGLTTDEANIAIVKAMRESGALLREEEMTHPYPHCWRCKQPILFRATEQWFCSVEAVTERACAEAEAVEWLPAWGRERMTAMLRERADWCISRQRAWGLPIPVYYCNNCEKPVVTKETSRLTARAFGEKGSNAWYEEDILPPGFACPHCGKASGFGKETSTLDGWFDSGSSHTVIRGREGHRFPADLYIEGNDQYRGWFQSSLLTSVASKERVAPYKTVVSHGFIVDEEKRKMSKSEGNVVDPLKIVRDYGADILRLWVAQSNYQNDVNVSLAMFASLSEIYKKIRNTCRFLLGNLYDFDPAAPAAEPEELDRWALWKLRALAQKARECYDAYEYHTVFHAVHNFCVIDMSNFYFDVIKDRLYCDKASGRSRRAAQGALYEILDTLVRLIAPLLSFTSEEIWGKMPHRPGHDTRSVLLNAMPAPGGAEFDKAEQWARLVALRSEANKAIEEMRAAKVIGKSLEAALTITTNDDIIREYENFLPQLLIVSKVTLQRGENAIAVTRAPGDKCARCWGVFETLGSRPEHPRLCARCADAVAGQ
ncbi:MAG: isoleucine--tRNA ligase [Oscillospiraceae bacterium]|jgi:isoleucyl-tRNA synthetase|nr:isoleucine--tRNA ligase [Oscillospiraceae bacterium]